MRAAIPVHPWLKVQRVAFVPGRQPLSPLEAHVFQGLEQAFRGLGHVVTAEPQPDTNLIFTTAPFGEPINWRRGLMFTARRRFGLRQTPTVVTVVGVSPPAFRQVLDRLEAALSKSPPDPADFAFPGMAPQAYQTLIEQGRRGGPLLALERVVQAQAKGLRILLAVGEREPQEAYLFDLVGAYPRLQAQDFEAFYTDIALRLVTALSAEEITEHKVLPPPIPAAVWQAAEAPKAMVRAGAAFGQRHFFTRMVRINDLVAVPALEASISEQYSEGCFATWEPTFPGLVATITGSARPVAKDALTEDELAVIVGVREDGRGALVRHVEGKRNDPPSSEAVELFAMDQPLPRIRWQGHDVPVIRSKLHGHRGVASFDPAVVEFAPMAETYHRYPVSCATRAQAEGIVEAFSRAASLRSPDDPRTLAFTIIPGHGLVVVEKWQPGKAAFQAIWEAMDRGALVISPHVPQGPHRFVLAADGRMHLEE